MGAKLLFQAFSSFVTDFINSSTSDTGSSGIITLLRAALRLSAASPILWARGVE